MVIFMREFFTLIQRPISVSSNAILLSSENSIGVDEVDGMAKLIQEYGITTICCVILIIFATIMFKELIGQNRKMDEKLLNSLNEALDTIKNIKDSNVNVAGCFDKHNMKSTMEFENVKRGLEDIARSIEDVNKENELLRKSVDEAKEQNERLQKMLDKQMGIIANLSQSINQSNGNKNTMSR